MNKNFTLYFCLLLLLSSKVKAQIGILNSPPLIPDTLVQRLAGYGSIGGYSNNGISVSNPTLTCADAASGYFFGASPFDFPISSGILLTTGTTVVALSPNISGSASSSNGGAGYPPLEELEAASGDTFNACVLEFDFTSQGETIKLDYIFASEEYPEWIDNQFEDVFALFIEGEPEYPASLPLSERNIATIPDTSIPVGINTVNSDEYSQFYIDNSGSTAIQYDGYTTKLTSEASVTPLNTYHLTIAIADVNDAIYDSGIFLEENSFKATNITTCSPDDNGNIYITTLSDNGDNENPTPGSLRAAIICANETAGANHIYIDTDAIPTDGPYLIQPLTELPTLTDAETTIDLAYTGNTSTGYVELDGSLINTSTETEAKGLTLQGNNSEICGLYIHSFPDDGVYVTGCDGCKIGSPNKGNIIAGNGTVNTPAAEQIIIAGASNIELVDNFVGTDLDGNNFSLETAGDSSEGIYISSSNNVIIGGDDAASGNVIAGNTGSGVWIDASTDIVLRNNHIGIGADGETDLGNNDNGIRINNSTSVNIGGLGLGNVIAGNGGDGIHIENISFDILIENNKIGTNSSGTTAVSNGGNGIFTDDSFSIVVNEENLISGNGSDGISLSNGSHFVEIKNNKIGTDQTGLLDLGNTLNGIRTNNSFVIDIGDELSGSGNVISGNGEYGIRLDEASEIIVIEGNTIGLDINNSNDLGNTSNGIYAYNSTNITIGGTVDGAGNTIAGNDENGILLWGNLTDNVLIQGNYIGLNSSGTAFGNTNDGIVVADNVQNTIIEGDNIISGNNSSGIWIHNFAVGTIVRNNKIGTSIDGTGDLGNGFSGIAVGDFASNTTIGGTEEADRNIISGNGHNGMWIGSGAFNIDINNNFIGTDINGTTAIPNDQSGIRIENSININIGNGIENLISGNAENGITIRDDADIINIEFNKIGTDISGLSAIPNNIGIDAASAHGLSILSNLVSGNLQDGIHLGNNTNDDAIISFNKIGTNVDGTVALGNGDDGVDIKSATGVTIENNLISGNADGIDISFAGNNAFIYNNRIGTNMDATAIISNLESGIEIDDSDFTEILDNTIGGNNESGIFIENTSDNTTISINAIGVNSDGTVNLANGEGIFIDNSTNTEVNGNLIGHNSVTGILISNADHIDLTGNFIGTNASGSLDLSNGAFGIEAFNTTNLQIGNNVGDIGGNTIANHSTGISIYGSSDTYTIHLNSLFCNNFAGIEISTDNAAPDLPIITYANSNEITGTAQANAAIELFLHNDTGCNGAPCQGKFVLGTTTADADGNWELNGSNFIQEISAGENIVATATFNGNTSEFTSCFEVCPILEPVISGETDFCAGSFTTLTASELTGTATNYLWSIGGDFPSIDVNVAGVYTVTVSDGGACTGTASIEVFQNENPNVSIFSPDGTGFCTGNSITLFADVFTSSIDVSYAWSAGESGQNIGVSEANVYTVTVTDQNNCSNTASIEIEEWALPTPSIEGEPNFCAGESTILSLNTSYESYVWSTNEVSPSIEVNEATVYTVTVTDGNDCSNTASIMVEEWALPMPVIEGENHFCAGESTVLSLNTGYEAYAWSTNEDSPSIEVGETGVYTVTITDGNNCSNTASISIGVWSLPTLVIEGELSFCPGGSTVLMADAVYASYLWSTGESSPSIEVSEIGFYGLTVVDGNGCSGETQVSVGESETPDVVVNGENFLCAPSILLSAFAIGGSGDYGYQWSDGSSSKETVVSEIGTYTVTVTDSKGCSSTAEKTVAVCTDCDVIAGFDLDVSYCLDFNLPLSESLVEGATLTGTWQVDYPSGNVLTSDNDETTTVSVLLNEVGTFKITYTVTDEFNPNCVDVHEVFLMVEDVPNANWTTETGLFEVCSTDLPLKILPESEGGFWSCEGVCDGFDESCLTTIDGLLYFDYDFNAVNQSKAIVSLNHTTACGESSSCVKHDITVYATPPSPTASISTETFCLGEVSEALIFVEVPILYNDQNFTFNLYDADDNLLLEGAKPNEDVIDVTEVLTTVGEHRFLIRTINGSCKSEAVEVSFFVESCNDCPVSIEGENTFCEGEFTLLTASDFNELNTYQWSNGASSHTIEATESGVYTLTVTDFNACVNTASIAVEEFPTPIISLDLSASVSIACGGGNIILTPTGAGEGATYHYYLDEAGNFPADPASGDVWESNEIVGQRIIYIFATTANECESAPLAISTYSYENISIGNLNTVCNDSNNTYTVSFDIFGGNGFYTVNDVSSTENFVSAPIPQGEGYSFEVDDSPLIPSCPPLIVSGDSPCNQSHPIEAVNDTIYLWEVLDNTNPSNPPFPVSFNILANDTGLGLTLQSLDYNITPNDLGEDLVSNENGNVIFYPTEGEGNQQTFPYEIMDEFGQTATANLTIVINVLVRTPDPATDLVAAIMGDCVPFENAVITGEPTAYAQMDSFLLETSYALTNTASHLFPSEDIKGILLSTGNAYDDLLSPNTTGSLGTNNGWEGDTDLMLDELETFDAAALEFDFTALSESIRFEYWFGSEEYPEWIESQFKDRMAIFISGPGFDTPQNIATVPMTNEFVGVETVNQNANSLYFDWNDYHTLPQYDGFTTLLEASAVGLAIDESYHIKIVIADVGDSEYDSGLFIKANTEKHNFELVVSDDVSIVEGESTTLSANVPNTSANITYEWTPSETLDDFNSPTPTATPTETTTYTVMATIGTCELVKSITVTVQSITCDGLSAGEMPIEDVYVCFGGKTGGDVPIVSENFNLRAGDVLGYVVQDETGTQLGYRTNDANFGFEEIEGATYNTPYFVMAVAGADNGNGQVDFEGDCVNRSNSFTVVFLEEITIHSQIVCDNNEQSIEVSLTGGLPAYLDSESYVLNEYELPIFAGETITIGSFESMDLLQLEATDSNACSASSEVQLYGLAILADGEDVTNGTVIINTGESVQLIAEVTGSEVVNYNWTPTEGLSFPLIPSVTASPDTNRVYQIEVTIENECVLTANITVLVRPAAYDCPDAILVCDTEPIQYNSNDFGVSEIPNGSCLALGENNSTWFRLQIDEATPNNTPLTFTISPNDGQTDYDFALYQAANCADLNEDSLIRCSYAPSSNSILTGLNMTETDTDDSDSDGFSRFVEVSSGEVYYLVVDNFSGNFQGFTLEWTNDELVFNCDSIPDPPDCLAIGGDLSLNQEVYCDEEEIIATLEGEYAGFLTTYLFLETDSTIIPNPEIGTYCLVAVNHPPEINPNDYTGIEDIEADIADGVCMALSNIVCFEVLELPTVPVLDGTFCDHEVFHIYVNVLEDAEIKWYADEELEIFITDENGIHIDTAGVYYVTQTIGECESKPLAIEVSEEDLFCPANCPDNLLQNFSFEAWDDCPEFAGDITEADFWRSPMGTAERADYFNDCNPSENNYGVPQNILGTQMAFEGVAYAGLKAYNAADNNLINREFIQTQLATPLEEGQTYCVSMQVSLSEKSQFAIDNLGFYFSANQVVSSDIEEILSPQVVHQGFLNDTENWVEVKGTFTATDALQHLAIGNFSPNNGVELVNGSGNGEAYYYIDFIEIRPTNELQSLLAFNEAGDLLNESGNTIVVCPGDILTLEATTTGTNFSCDLGWIEALTDTIHQATHTVQPTEDTTVYHFWVSNGLCEVADSLVVVFGIEDENGDCELSACPQVIQIMGALENIQVELPYEITEMEVNVVELVQNELLKLASAIPDFDMSLLAGFQVSILTGNLQTECNPDYLDISLDKIVYDNSQPQAYAYIGEDALNFNVLFPSCGESIGTVNIDIQCPIFETDSPVSDCNVVPFRLSSPITIVHPQDTIMLDEAQSIEFGWSYQYKIEGVNQDWMPASETTNLDPNLTYEVLMRVVNPITQVPIFHGSHAEECFAIINSPSLNLMPVEIVERCLGDDRVELTAVVESTTPLDGYDFVWSNDETEHQIIVTAPFDDFYAVEVTRLEDDCNGMDSIFQVGPPDIDIEYTDASRCLAIISVQGTIPQSITCHDEQIPEENCWWDEAQQSYLCELTLLEPYEEVAEVIVSDSKGCVDSIALFNCIPKVKVIKPNPSSRLFTIELTGIPINTPIQYQIYSVDGRLALQSENVIPDNPETLENWRTIHIDLDERFVSGMYFVTFSVGSIEGSNQPAFRLNEKLIKTE